MDVRGKRRLLAVIVAGAVVLGAGGVAAASWVRSPQQAAAEREAPEPSVLTAPVENRILSDTVVVRGLVSVSGTFAVNPGASGDGAAVVTGVRAARGDEVTAGSVLIEVSGRPVFVLAGTVPAYRDLLPGAEGADIAQLQAALTGLGFETGSDDEGEFGAGTKAAVAEFYESIGYAAPTTGDETEVKAAAETVKAADRALEQAKRDLRRLEEAADEAREQAAPAAEEAEKAERAAAQGEAGMESGPGGGEQESPGEGEDPGAVEIDEEALEDARYQVELAEEDLADAEEAHAETVRTSGVMVPLSEFVFAPTIPALVHEIAVGVGDEITEAAVTLSAGELVVTTRIDSERRELLDVDMPLEILAERHDLTVAGTVAAIGEFTDDAEQGPGHAVTIQPADVLPRELAGEDVRITITAASTSEPVLVVPLSAVSAAADGTTVVVKTGPGGVQERVIVRAGVSGDGFVEVTPASDAMLGEGDLVVVGAQ